jgi:hypothetical protein
MQVLVTPAAFKEHGLGSPTASSSSSGVPPVTVKGLARRVGSVLDRMTGAPSGRRASTTAAPGAAAPAPAAGLFAAKPVAYVNSLAVTVTVNASNDRVALVFAGRFLPDAKKDEFHGRVVDRTTVCV